MADVPSIDPRSGAVAEVVEQETDSQHTSVGTSAIRRFLRPVSWQDAPPELLPPELVDGVLVLPGR